MISVIVPTHNRRELLMKKLEALQSQAGAFEVIVVADGCTDDTPRYLNDYKPRYPFKVIYTNGQGAAFARNRGAEASQGEILLFSDDDVLPQADWLEVFAQAFSQSPAVYLGAYEAEGRAWKPVYRWHRLNFNNVNGVALALPKVWFEGVGRFAEWLSGYGGEDLELGYRLQKANHPLRYLPNAKACHQGPTSESNLTRARQAGAQAARIARHHRDSRLYWELGVHPVILGLKLALLPALKLFAGNQLDGDLAYCWGAWETRYDLLESEGKSYE